MTSFGIVMPEAIERAMKYRDELISLRNMPGVSVDLSIALVTNDINRAVQAQASGDVVAMLRAYEQIKDYEA